LRFNQFHDSHWIKTSLKDVAKKINAKNKNKFCKNVISNSAQHGLIRQIDYFDKEIAQNESIENYTIINKGDFVYNPRKSIEAPYGPVNIYNFDETGIVSPLYLCFSTQNINKKFLHYYFKSKAWHRFVYLYGDSGARHDRVSIKDEVFFSQQLSIPTSSDEIEKITDLLFQVEQRINTQSKIIEDLKVQKKYICNKIFHNKSDSLITLKHILKERIEKSIVNNQYEPLSSTVKGLFTQKEYFDGERSVLSNVGYKVVHLNDIILSPQNLWMGNITLNQRFERGIVSPSYKTYTINSDYDCYYIFNMLKTNRAIYKYIMCSEQGASVVRRNLNIDDFLDLKFNIPNIETQKRMGNIIKLMDEKILIEQNVLEKLKEQKKYLLSNMFI